MKTHLLLLVCLATLPVLVSAQNTLLPTNAPETSNKHLGSNSLFEPVQPRHFALRAQDARSEPNLPSVPAAVTVSKSHVLTEESYPRVALGTKDVRVSGPLVNSFRGASDSQDRTSVGGSILDMPLIGALVPERLPKSVGEGEYWQWGESDRPWSAVCERRNPGSESVLFSIRF